MLRGVISFCLQTVRGYTINLPPSAISLIFLQQLLAQPFAMCVRTVYKKFIIMNGVHVCFGRPTNNKDNQEVFN